MVSKPDAAREKLPLFPGYELINLIYESPNSLVYRGWCKQNRQAVILKVLKQDYPTPEEITRYKQEYAIAQSFSDVKGVVQAYKLEKYQNTLVMFLEDFGGESLRILMSQGWGSHLVANISEFLYLAIKISKILGKIHNNQVIHKDINPSNIVLNPVTKQLKIIDFGISTALTKENPRLQNPTVLEGTLAYISPEQTGRMNRALDYRTDFYSLGVTFYELLTGELPFTTKDPLELVHCHIAKIPPTPLHPYIPIPLINIVAKLMAKTAEERYQSAWGLKYDLEQCLVQWQETEEIKPFTLGSRDICDRFQIPQKLYGREQEVVQLLEAFERVSQRWGEEGRNCNSELFLVAGYSGIGKSALVQEIYKPITKRRGYFIRGKFDQFQRNIPYAAIIQAFKELIEQLLTESTAQLRKWQGKLLEALGNNGQLIIDVIPAVELIIGKQPALPELGAIEAQNRFNLVFQKFIQVFCQPQHPLVIFLDDLQWVDAATLKLLELMLTGQDNLGNLLLIGAYRDNEVSPAHPLIMSLEDMEQQGATVNQITLTPLNLDCISQLIADTLHSDQEAVQSLAQLVLSKTGGNPFFVNEFLKTLYAENLLTFEFASFPGWYWETRKIEALGITDNVVELTINKIKKMPAPTQQALSLAAAIGADFDLKTLSLISNQSPAQIFRNLNSAIQAELIQPASSLDEELLIQKYRFGHDRIQQAAYALVEEEKKPALHLKIGRLLWKNAQQERLNEQLFTIVDHLNLGVGLLTNSSEKEAIAKLNLAAGEKAKAATAYQAAYQYLQDGLQLLELQPWQTQYDLALTLYEETAEAAYLSTDFVGMTRLAKVVQREAKTLLEKVRICEIQIQAYVAQNKLHLALETALHLCQELGVSFPKKINLIGN